MKDRARSSLLSSICDFLSTVAGSTDLFGAPLSPQCPFSLSGELFFPRCFRGFGTVAICTTFPASAVLLTILLGESPSWVSLISFQSQRCVAAGGRILEFLVSGTTLLCDAVNVIGVNANEPSRTFTNT